MDLYVFPKEPLKNTFFKSLYVINSGHINTTIEEPFLCYIEPAVYTNVSLEKLMFVVMDREIDKIENYQL